MLRLLFVLKILSHILEPIIIELLNKRTENPRIVKLMLAGWRSTNQIATEGARPNHVSVEILSKGREVWEIAEKPISSVEFKI